MKLEFSGDHAPHDGNLTFGGSLPPWLRGESDQTVIRDADPERSNRLEFQPQQTEGWTVQKARSVSQ